MIRFILGAITSLALAGTALADDMKLAVTTSFHNSGLADTLLPQIKQDTGIEVQLLVVGTGQAIKLGAFTLSRGGILGRGFRHPSPRDNVQ